MQDQWSQAKDDRDFKCNKKKTAGETAAAAQDAYDEAEKEEKLSQTTFTEAAKKEELDADELQKVSKLVAQTKEEAESTVAASRRADATFNRANALKESSETARQDAVTKAAASEKAVGVTDAALKQTETGVKDAKDLVAEAEASLKELRDKEADKASAEAKEEEDVFNTRIAGENAVGDAKGLDAEKQVALMAAKTAQELIETRLKNLKTALSDETLALESATTSVRSSVEKIANVEDKIAKATSDRTELKATNDAATSGLEKAKKAAEAAAATLETASQTRVDAQKIFDQAQAAVEMANMGPEAAQALHDAAMANLKKAKVTLKDANDAFIIAEQKKTEMELKNAVAEVPPIEGRLNDAEADLENHKEAVIKANGEAERAHMSVDAVNVKVTERKNELTLEETTLKKEEDDRTKA